MGRPKLPDNQRKSALVQIRLTQKEKKILLRTANQQGVTVADLVRDTLIQGAL
jgi:uncharacterized protein (DUF1778 family)